MDYPLKRTTCSKNEISCVCLISVWLSLLKPLGRTIIRSQTPCIIIVFADTDDPSPKSNFSETMISLSELGVVQCNVIFMQNDDSNNVSSAYASDISMSDASVR